MSSPSCSINSCGNSLNNVPLHSTSSVGAKLRRLKIQEDILFQGVRKYQKELIESEEYGFTDVHIFEYHKFMKNLNNKYIKIKHLFEDVKFGTQSKDSLKSEDIDDIKDNVIELENNIRSCKKYLQKELGILKAAEIELDKEMTESPKEISKITKLTKIPTTPYNEIVPSPVRIIMNSPFKCTEVQDFQDFMKNSPNRYGGWNEYNHNIFVKFWHKYYTVFDCENPDLRTEFARDPNKLTLLCHDLYQNIQGLTREDIISHYKWYSQFIYLKHRQDLAINKWKLNKFKLKKTPLKERVLSTSTVRSNDSNRSPNTRLRTKNITSFKNVVADDLNHINSYINSDHLNYFEQEQNGNEYPNYRIDDETQQETRLELQYLKPTKQWNNRCKGEINDKRVYKLEDITKRWGISVQFSQQLIPSWRLGL